MQLSSPSYRKATLEYLDNVSKQIGTSNEWEVLQFRLIIIKVKMGYVLDEKEFDIIVGYALPIHMAEGVNNV